MIGGETLSKIIDWEDRATCVLFGDGAGGAYVEKSEEAGIICEDIGSCGDRYNILTEGYTACSNAFNEVPSGVHPEWYVHMDGREVFKFATKNVIRSMQKVMSAEGITDDKFYMNMERYGNTSSASIPIALNELNEKGLLARGDKVIMSGFGGGMTWGTMLIVW